MLTVLVTTISNLQVFLLEQMSVAFANAKLNNDIVSFEKFPASILYKSIAGRYRPVSYHDGPITARFRFIKNAYRTRPWYRIYTDLSQPM